MKIKVSDATPIQLAYLIAQCEGRTIRRDPMKFYDGSYWIWEETPSGKGGIDINKSVYMRIGYKFSPSTKWEQGGPIIERERMTLNYENIDGTGQSKAYYLSTLFDDDLEGWGQCGPTPLIAAMRCYVASKLGDEVEIPDELCGEV